MVTMREIAIAVNNYAPKLDEVEKIQFAMFIHNQIASEDNLNGLNLASWWLKYRA